MPDFHVLLVETHSPGQKGSMERYAAVVHRALCETQVAKDGLRVSRINLAFPWAWPAWIPGNVRTWLNHAWLLLLGRYRVERIHADLVHLLDGSHAYLLNGLKSKPAMATVHDLIPMIQLEGQLGQGSVSRMARVILRKTRLGLQNCVHLVADSRNTADDITKSITFPLKGITVVAIALDPVMTAQDRDSEIRSPKCFPGGEAVILHVGNNGFYKNREGVIRIYSHIASHVAARLVMAGPEPTSSMRKLVRESGLDEKVSFVIDPDDRALVDLYRQARLFLFPSLYEGFGWPPLEAMACGCPVVCSNAGSLPEVVGDAALTAPAVDEEVLAQLCVDLLTNPAIAEDRIRKGRQRAEQFTLERMGQQLANAYATVDVARRG